MAEKQAETVRKLTGIPHIAETILSQLDVDSLRNASRVSPYWQSLIRDGRLWKRQLEKKVASDRVWAEFAKQRRSSLPEQLDNKFQDEIFYEQVEADVNELDDRWNLGQYTTKLYPTLGDSHRNGDEIATVSKDECLRIWNTDTGSCVQTYSGAQSNRLERLRFDHRMIICAYEGGELRIWDRSDPDGSGPCNVIRRPNDGFHKLEFNNNFVIINDLSKRSVIVFEIYSPRDVRYCTTLDARDQMYVEFRDLIICHFQFNFVDRRTYELRRLHNQEHLEFAQKHGLLVNLGYQIPIEGYQPKIDIWDLESGTCMRTLDGGEDFVALDSNRLAVAHCVSRLANYRIRIWNLKEVLDRSIADEDLQCTVIERRYEKFSDFIYGMEINEFQLTMRQNKPGRGCDVLDFRGGLA